MDDRRPPVIRQSCVRPRRVFIMCRSSTNAALCRDTRFVVVMITNQKTIARSHIDLHTHAGSAFDIRVTLIFDLLTSGSTHAEVLPQCVRVPSLVLIARVDFLLDRGHADTHKIHKCHRSTARVDNNCVFTPCFHLVEAGDQKSVCCKRLLYVVSIVGLVLRSSVTASS